MNNEEIIKKIENLETKIDNIFISTEKTRKYFLIIIWVSVIAVIIPLSGLLFTVPSFLGTYNSILNIQ